MQTGPLFAAQLTPHRAMTGNGIRWVIAVTAVLASIPGAIFFAMGAWPIVGFMGLDVLVLYWALSHSLKDGDAFEEVTLWPDALRLRHVSARGRETTHDFNPFFVRFAVRRDDENRVTRMTLAMRGKEVEIGAFLNPDDKASFAEVFGAALSRARR